MVDDHADVRAVNAHSKGIGGHYQVTAALHEAFLDLCSLSLVQPGVVSLCVYSA